MQYSIEPRTSKYLKGYGFCFLLEICPQKYGKQLLDNALKI